MLGLLAAPLHVRDRCPRYLWQARPISQALQGFWGCQKASALSVGFQNPDMGKCMHSEQVWDGKKGRESLPASGGWRAPRRQPPACWWGLSLCSIDFHIISHFWAGSLEAIAAIKQGFCPSSLSFRPHQCSPHHTHTNTHNFSPSVEFPNTGKEMEISRTKTWPF